MSTGVEDGEAAWFAAQREMYNNGGFGVSCEEEEEDEQLLRDVPCANDIIPMYGDPMQQEQEQQQSIQGPHVIDDDRRLGLMRDDSSLVRSSHRIGSIDDVGPRGVCEYPPLATVSFMMRGDNGVVRWLTASGLKVERTSRKRGRKECIEEKEDVEVEEDGEEEEDGEQQQVGIVRELRRRHNGDGLGFVNIPMLLQQLYDEAASVDDQHIMQPSSSSLLSSSSHQRMGDGDEVLWVSKYSPKKFRDLLSDDNLNLKLLQWLKSWDAYIFQEPSTSMDSSNNNNNNTAPTRPEERLAILVGPPGVGKTTLAHVLAAHCGYETIEINASVDRTASRMENAIQLAVASSSRARRRAPEQTQTTTTTTLLHTKGVSGTIAKTGEVVKGASLVDMLLRPKCLIIDEMDGISANVATFLLQQDIHCPVFCLCNDFYVPSLRSLRRQCQHVYYFKPIRPQRLLSRLSEISELEGLPVSQLALADLVQSSNGDIRCCLNTLQFLYRHASQGGDSNATLQLIRDMQGKDTKMSLWDAWRVVFERQERSKYIHLLQKECSMDYAATLMAGIQNKSTSTNPRGEKRNHLDSTGQQHQHQHHEEDNVALGFRVDPGHVYVSHMVQQCGDTNTLLDGLQEYYVQRSYADYSFNQTRSMADGFSFQDKLAACSYRDAASASLIPFVEQYACTTAAMCFTCCSSSRRSGATIGFPRESMGLKQRLSETINIASTFRDGCRIETLAHMSSVDTISQEIAPLLLRSLLDVSLHVPAHSMSSVSSFSPQDQSLLLASIARHAEYGLTYTRASIPGKGSYAAEEAVEEHWELTPPIHRLGVVSVDRARPNAPAQRATLATPQQRASSAASRTAAATIMVLRVREELRQMMVGEIQRFIIQRNARQHGRSRPPKSLREEEPQTKKVEGEGERKKLKREGEETVGELMADVKKKDKADDIAAPTHPATLLGTVPSTVKFSGVAPTANSKPGAKRDFFGRLIPEDTGKSSLSKTPKNPAATKTTVQYAYHDGCTNAVKIPAAFSDF